MSDFAETWNLIRGRFNREFEGLNAVQLNWRLHPGALTLGEMAIHVAGVEVWFHSQLEGIVLEGVEARIARAATDGSVNNRAFPFADDEITPDFVAEALAMAAERVRHMIESPTPELREKRLISALGPEIDGTGALARLAYHPGYHHGQAYLIKTAPGFPG